MRVWGWGLLNSLSARENKGLFNRGNIVFLLSSRLRGLVSPLLSSYFFASGPPGNWRSGPHAAKHFCARVGRMITRIFITTIFDVTLFCLVVEALASEALQIIIYFYLNIKIKDAYKFFQVCYFFHCLENGDYHSGKKVTV